MYYFFLEVLKKCGVPILHRNEATLEEGGSEPAQKVRESVGRKETFLRVFPSKAASHLQKKRSDIFFVWRYRRKRAYFLARQARKQGVKGWISEYGNS